MEDPGRGTLENPTASEEGDREERKAMYPGVDEAHWGVKYWEKQRRLRNILLQDAEKDSFEHYVAYEHFTVGYRAYGAVKNDQFGVTAGLESAGTRAATRSRPGAK